MNDSRPLVLFICVKNGGKSQMAAALARRVSAEDWEVASAGTRPGASLNSESVEALTEVGATVEGEHPKLIDEALLQRAARVVVLGQEAQVREVDGMVGSIETWEIDEPSERGITGMERMRLVRDDIARRVDRLHQELCSP
ncbi:MAG: low molecular weight phosphatase family protein [Brachybacterium sp.]|nr:low molecular weight phosphatase family protein [Brachybacterium sp.]